MNKEFVNNITEWYKQNSRDLPWRTNRNAYSVWISEIMLQQTRIEAVIPYYARFMEAFPDVFALADAEEELLLKIWQGLGYYSRARNLKKTAQIIVSEYGGVLPKESKLLKKLPGIGDYTAGAIASIAYGMPEPAVDGNVLRIMMRLWASDDDVLLPAAKKKTEEALRKVYPNGDEARLLTEGLMELGQRICTVKGEPKCESCPIAEHCLAYWKDETSLYPVRIKKSKRRMEERTVILLCCKGRYALQKRPETGLLASLWEFPNIEGRLHLSELSAYAAKLGGNAVDFYDAGEAKHIFTHLEWHMTGRIIECTAPFGEFEWLLPEEIEAEYALSSAFIPYIKAAFHHNEIMKK